MTARERVRKIRRRQQERREEIAWLLVRLADPSWYDLEDIRARVAELEGLDTIAVQLEAVRKEIPIAYAYDDTFFSLMKQRSKKLRLGSWDLGRGALRVVRR